MFTMTKNGNMVFDKEATILELIERDGYVCQYPGCTLPFDPDKNDKHSLSIDHIHPKIRAKADGWTEEQIWATENLQLMGRSCNAKKGSHLYDEEGNLPQPRIRPVKLPRPDLCDTCANGRLLLFGEICGDCGSEPQPKSAPKYAQKSPRDCSHGWTIPSDHCWMCWIGHIERAPASRVVFGVNDE